MEYLVNKNLNLKNSAKRGKELKQTLMKRSSKIKTEYFTFNEEEYYQYFEKVKEKYRLNHP